MVYIVNNDVAAKRELFAELIIAISKPHITKLNKNWCISDKYLFTNVEINISKCSIFGITNLADEPIDIDIII